MSRRWAIAVLILLAIAVAVIIYLVRQENDLETVTVERGSLDVTIQTVGTIVTSREVVLRARSQGVIDTVAVSPGDTVEAMDIVVLLERETFQERIDEAERAVEDAEFALQFAEQEDPSDAGAASASDAVLRARRQLDEAQRALQSAKDAMRDSVILAPEPGIILDVMNTEGDPVNAGQPVARLFQKSDLRLVARVDELGLPSVSVGAPVSFWLDAFPAEMIQGTVVGTAPSAEQEAGVAFFDTTVGFDPPAELDIRPGMNAEVTITTDLREDVLLIPERAIQSVGERAFVRVVDGDQVREVEIQLGHRGNGMVEVVQGLEEGDRVVVE